MCIMMGEAGLLWELENFYFIIINVENSCTA